MRGDLYRLKAARDAIVPLIVETLEAACRDIPEDELWTTVATLQKIVEHLFALCITNLLQNDLFGSLCANTTKIDRFQLFFDGIAYFDIGVLFAGFTDWQLRVFVFEIRILNDFPATESLKIARLTIDDDTHVGLVVNALFCRRRKRQLKCSEDNVLGHIFFARQHIYQQ